MNFPRHGGPAEQGRGGSGQAADYDVLRCSALQEQGVDNRVAKQCSQG